MREQSFEEAVKGAAKSMGSYRGLSSRPVYHTDAKGNRVRRTMDTWADTKIQKHRED